MSEKAPSMVFSGTSSRYLTEKIYASLNCPLGDMNIAHFADGEFTVPYEESIRDAHVLLVQSTFPNFDNLMGLLLIIDATKRASAKNVVAVISYFGWARQDRKDKPRVSISTELVADLLSVTGIDRLTTMDLHAGQIQGLFNIPVDHLCASVAFFPCIQSLKLEELVIATPDVDGSKGAGISSKYLSVSLVLCNKLREKANEVASMQIIGDVKDKNVVLIDDIVDTAGTITRVTNTMLEAGANSVRAIVSHCAMSNPASFRVQGSELTEMIFTDSIPYSKKCVEVKQLSIADIFAETIKRVMNNESISPRYII